MQRIYIMHCFICKMSILSTALYVNVAGPCARVQYYPLLYMQFSIMHCFICNSVLYLSTALSAIWQVRMSPHLYLQSGRYRVSEAFGQDPANRWIPSCDAEPPSQGGGELN